jgi:hypothetical protein
MGGPLCICEAVSSVGGDAGSGTEISANSVSMSFVSVIDVYHYGCGDYCAQIDGSISDFVTMPSFI